jgi:hypothetical protein
LEKTDALSLNNLMSNNQDDNDYPPSKSGKKKASKTATELVNLVSKKEKVDHG